VNEVANRLRMNSQTVGNLRALEALGARSLAFVMGLRGRGSGLLSGTRDYRCRYHSPGDVEQA